MTGCFAVLTHKLVQCHQTGNPTVGANGITTAAEGCRITSPRFPVDPSTQPASSLGVCTNGSALSQATLLIGAVNDHATQLAEVMYDNTNQPSLHPKSYAIACSVDMEPSIHFQSVSFSRIERDTNFVWAQGTSFTVQSNSDTCKPIPEEGPIDPSTTITSPTLAYSVAASRQ